MKHLYSIAIILILAFSANAQNWQPFYLNDTCNYTISDSGLITNNLLVVSAKHDGEDSIYRFNTTIRNESDYLFNKDTIFLGEPNLFGYTMRFNGDGTFYFMAKDSFNIDVTKNESESWMFTNTLTATVDSSREVILFGEVDSVKYISLSDGRKMSISKQHGITTFPNKEENKMFELVGIQSRYLGEQLPRLKDYFTYQPGDVLEYVTHTINYADGTDERISVSQITIKSLVKMDTDSIIYMVDYKGRNTKIYYYNDYETTKFDRKDQRWVAFVKKRDVDIFSNPTNNPVKQVHINGYDYPYENLYILPSYAKGLDSSYYINFAGGEGNLFGDKPIGFNNYEFYTPLETDSTILTNNARRGYGGELYKEGVGLMYRDRSAFETNGSEYIAGYIINGDTIGKMNPNGFFTDVDEIKIQETNITIYPNPATNQVTVQLEGYQSGDAVVKIYNTSGQVVMEKQHNFSSGDLTMDVATLPKGIYYVRVMADELIATKKLIIN